MPAVAPVAQGTDTGQRIILTDVTWETYEQLLKNFVDRSVPRLAYDRGVLEIASPGSEHEQANRALAQVVAVIAEEWDIELLDIGSMTYKRRHLGRGFEPDASYYIQNVTQLIDRRRIDSEINPPPDLVIEIDINHSSLDKLALYAAVGVPEVWRFDDGRVAIFVVDDDGYHEVTASRAIPLLGDDHLNRFLAENQTRSWIAWIRGVRNWARTRRPNPLG